MPEDIDPVVEIVELNGEAVHITKQSDGFTAWTTENGQIEGGGCGKIPTIEEARAVANKILRNQPIHDYSQPKPIAAYLGGNGKLTEFLGAVIGTYYVTNTWKRATRYMGNMTFQSVRAVVQGWEYQGRASDNGTLIFLRPRKRNGQPIKAAA